jgi:hypothetical protein
VAVDQLHGPLGVAGSVDFPLPDGPITAIASPAGPDRGPERVGEGHDQPGQGPGDHRFQGGADANGV